MPGMKVDGCSLQQQSGQCSRWGRDLAQLGSVVSAVRKDMRSKLRSREKIGLQLDTLNGRLLVMQNNLKGMSADLLMAADSYQLTEDRVGSRGQEIFMTGGKQPNGWKGKLPVTAPVYVKNNEKALDHHILTEDSHSGKEHWLQKEWEVQGDFLGIPASLLLNGSLLGREWDFGDVKTAGDGIYIGKKAEVKSWLAQGNMSNSWGLLGLTGSATALSLKGNADAVFGWEDKGLMLPWLYAGAGLEADALEATAKGTLGKEQVISLEGSGSVGYGELGFSMAAGRLPDGSIGFSNQYNAEIGAAKGEVKAGLTLWGIEGELSLEGRLHALGTSGGYEFSNQSLQWNLGAALGLGAKIGVKIDWSGIDLPQWQWPWWSETLKKGGRKE